MIDCMNGTAERHAREHVYYIIGSKMEIKNYVFVFICTYIGIPDVIGRRRLWPADRFLLYHFYLHMHFPFLLKVPMTSWATGHMLNRESQGIISSKSCFPILDPADSIEILARVSHLRIRTSRWQGCLSSSYLFWIVSFHRAYFKCIRAWCHIQITGIHCITHVITYLYS